MQCFGACSRQHVLEDKPALKDEGQTQIPCHSAAADTKLSSLKQSGLTQQPDAASSCEQHAVSYNVNIEPSPTGSLDSVASATSLSFARKQVTGSAGVDSSYASAGSAAACSTSGLHSAMADTALISSAASARHLQCRSAQQSVLFAPAVLPNRHAFSRSGRAAHLELFAVAQALTTLKNKNTDQVFPLWEGHQGADMLMPKEYMLVNDVPRIADGMQAALTQHPSDQLTNQGWNERSGYDLGTFCEANFSWDYIESPQQSKGFFGHRKCDITRSLDIDFNNNEPMAVTRRSKEYGERARQSDSRSVKDCEVLPQEVHL
ncbi:TPA: hypothetical protein ACH3X1_013572 [Trebouxia sp. C0004]